MTATRPRRRAHRGSALLAAVLLLGAVACSGDDGTDAESGDDGGTTTTAATLVEPERFEGETADFYVVPDPLPPGEPGDLIRVQELESGTDEVTLRIMYHSIDGAGRDRAVTGIATYPTAEPPEGGWPVVSTANGTVGLAGQCALSRHGSPAAAWGIEGVRVQSDYIGMGPVGEIHPYLSRLSEGHSVIDAVRAVRNLPDANASERWVVAGHSQGGHGSLSAHELSEEYAPELDLVATLTMAPAAMFGDTFDDPMDSIVSNIVGMMGLRGNTTEHDELVFEDYAADSVVALGDGIFTDQCLDGIISSLVSVAFGGLWKVDPYTTEPAASILAANDVGFVALDTPVFLVSGTADDRVVIDRALALFDRLCETGQTTELLVIDGADHGSVLGATADRTAAWLNARLDGEPPADSCGDPDAKTPVA